MIRATLAPSSEREHLRVHLQTDHDTDKELWWQTTAGEPPPLPNRLDAAAIALVPKAMNFRQDLHLVGSVSWSLLANLESFIEAWTTWRPDLFGPITITAEEVIDDRRDGAPLADRAVMAFSGGVDGTYAAYAQTMGPPDRRRLTVASAVLIHGYDIPRHDLDGFAAAERSARAITAELGVPLVSMRTNWQDVANPDWQLSFGPAIASMLHLFTDRAGTVCMAADNTYGSITLPWGSNPVTSPLLSSRRMRLRLEGAGATRTQKCAAIGTLASVREHIRVCWAGEDLGRNCGTCEKCVRTKVNFLAAGFADVPALGPIEPGQVRGITVGSAGARAILEELRGDLDALPQDVRDDVAWLLDRSSPAVKSDRNGAAPGTRRRRGLGRRTPKPDSGSDVR